MEKQPIYEPDEDTFLMWDCLQAEIAQKVSGKSRKEVPDILSACSLLDMGAGSGYLGFEAGKLGIGRVVFVDINPESVSYVKGLLESEDLFHSVILSDVFSNVHGSFDLLFLTLLICLMKKILHSLQFHRMPYLYTEVLWGMKLQFVLYKLCPST